MMDFRYIIAAFLQRIVHWLDGSRYGYDEFDHGFREGLKAAKRKANKERSE